MRLRKLAAILGVFVTVITGCGGDGETDSSTTQPATTAPAAAAATTTAAPTTIATTTTTTTTSTTEAPSACPQLPALPADAVASSRFEAGDGRTVDVVEVTSEGNQSVTDTTVRVTYADGGAAELVRSQVQLDVLGFFDVNQDGADELFLLDGGTQLRLWIVTDADCELNIAEGRGAPLGASILGGGEALLIDELKPEEEGDVAAGVACVDGKIRTHYFFLDPSPSMAGMARVDINEAELVDGNLVVSATERPTLSLEEAAELQPLDCGDLALPEAG